jgi:serpin B
LDGETLHQMLAGPQQATVYTAIPKFETECSVELADILAAMGMPDAFDPDRADFSALGSSTDGSVHISRVVHKTFLSMAEKGTRAGAATMVAVADGAAAPQEPKEVYLDRPFICMLVDTENDIPFFIGTVMDVGK